MTDGNNPVSPPNATGQAATAMYQKPLFWLALLVVAALAGTAGYALSSSTKTPTTLATTTTVASTTTTSSSTTTTTNSGTTTCTQDLAKTYIQVTSVTALASGGATLVAHPVTLHCGGPDDRQYLPQASNLNITLTSNAQIVILDQNFAPLAANVGGLQNYVTANTDGNIFFVDGPLNAATSLTAAFHP
jgi:hypothetical protein